MAFINEVMESVFIGFSLFILATSFVRFRDEKRNEFLINLTDSAIMIIRFAGIIFLVTWFANLYEHYQSEEEYYAMMSRMTGPYWLGYWIYPFSYGIFPQLLWVKKIKRIKAIRILTALLLLFAIYVERLVIWITSFHRDYVPSSWTTLPKYLIVYDWALHIITFALILGAVHFVKVKLTNVPRSQPQE